MMLLLPKFTADKNIIECNLNETVLEMFELISPDRTLSLISTKHKIILGTQYFPIVLLRV